MGFEPTHAFTRLLRFQHSLLSLLSNLPYLLMEPVGIEPTSKHLPTHLSTTIGYVLDLTSLWHITQAQAKRVYQSLIKPLDKA